MIRIDKLSKKYDKEYVLNNLSCTIKDNCIYGLVGANGAGKSTLLRIIMGIFESDEGVITIDDELVDDNTELKQKMVFVPDDLFFYPGYTLLDTAKYYESMYKDFDMNYLKELAGILNLSLNKKISTFSKDISKGKLILTLKETDLSYMYELKFEEKIEIKEEVKMTITNIFEKERTLLGVDTYKNNEKFIEFESENEKGFGLVKDGKVIIPCREVEDKIECIVFDYSELNSYEFESYKEYNLPEENLIYRFNKTSIKRTNWYYFYVIIYSFNWR